MTIINRQFDRKPVKNLSSTTGTVRGISNYVQIGGVTLFDPISWSKTDLAYGAGSSCEITLRANDDIAIGGFSTQSGQSYKQDWLTMSQTILPLPVLLFTTMSVDGKVIFDKAEEFSGIVDTISIDLGKNSLVLNCTSYARILVNAKITETVAGDSSTGKTTSQVVDYLVKKYGKGLKSQIYNFTTPVGNIYKQQQVKTLRNIAVWDVIESFAEKDNADVFVKGDTLYYVPKPTEVKASVTDLGGVTADYSFDYLKDFIDCKIEHAALYSHDVTVTVRSYQRRTKQSYESKYNMKDQQIDKTAAALEMNPDVFDQQNAASLARMRQQRPRELQQAKVTTPKIQSKESYVFNIPNATQEDCDRIARKITEDITRKEFLIELTVNAQPDFNPRQFIKLNSMPYEILNQVYAIKSITTGAGNGEGYQAKFTLVNHHVQSAGTSLGT